MAEVLLLDGKAVAPGARAFAQLRLAEPGLYLPGDRFILRQFSPVVTIGGGVVLDNHPPKHRLNDPSVLRSLEVMETGDALARLEILARQSGEIELSAIVARTGWQPAEALRVGKRLEAEKQLVILGQPPSVFVHGEHFAALERGVLAHLEKFHAANPLIGGLSKEDLRGRMATRVAGTAHLPSVTLFNGVLQGLAAQKRVQVRGETLLLAGRGIQLTPEESAAKEQISRAFEKTGLAVPSAKEVLEGLRIDRARAEKLLRILLKDGTLVKVTEDLIFHAAALAALRETVARRKTQSNRLNVAVFKELTGLSRKYAIPLLEYLDRERVTRREGDERIIL